MTELRPCSGSPSRCTHPRSRLDSGWIAGNQPCQPQPLHATNHDQKGLNPAGRASFLHTNVKPGHDFSNGEGWRWSRGGKAGGVAPAEPPICVSLLAAVPAEKTSGPAMASMIRAVSLSFDF